MYLEGADFALNDLDKTPRSPSAEATTFEGADITLATMGDSVTEEMKALVKESNEKQAAAMRGINILVLTLPSTGNEF